MIKIKKCVRFFVFFLLILWHYDSIHHYYLKNFKNYIMHILIIYIIYYVIKEKILNKEKKNK